MKPCISILLLALAAPLCFAQGIAKSLNDQPQISGQPQSADQDLERLLIKQRWCPVDLISATIDTPARYLPVTTPESNSGSLDLTFRNVTDKKIVSSILESPGEGQEEYLRSGRVHAHHASGDLGNRSGFGRAVAETPAARAGIWGRTGDS